jgi:hypothetical protein
VATTYQRCDETVRELPDELIEQHRADLAEGSAGATIELLFAFGDGGPALKKDGQVERKPDGSIEVTIDADAMLRIPPGQPASTVGHGLGCGTISDPAPTDVPGSGIPTVGPGEWQLFPVDQVAGLPNEVRQALKADGVTWCGEWQAGLVNNTLKAFDKLKCSVVDEAMETMDRAIHHLVPHCRVCGWCDGEYYPYGLELGPNFVPDEKPPLCLDCRALKDGPPHPDQVEAEIPTSTYCYPVVLQKRPAKDPAKHLANLQAARDDLVASIDAKATLYSSLAQKWPGPESNCFNPGFQGNPRTGFVNGVRQALDNLAAARGHLVLLDTAIAEAQVKVDQAAAAKAAKKSAPKKTA